MANRKAGVDVAPECRPGGKARLGRCRGKLVESARLCVRKEERQDSRSCASDGRVLGRERGLTRHHTGCRHDLSVCRDWTGREWATWASHAAIAASCMAVKKMARGRDWGGPGPTLNSGKSSVISFDQASMGDDVPQVATASACSGEASAWMARTSSISALVGAPGADGRSESAESRYHILQPAGDAVSSCIAPCVAMGEVAGEAASRCGSKTAADAEAAMNARRVTGEKPESLDMIYAFQRCERQIGGGPGMTPRRKLNRPVTHYRACPADLVLSSAGTPIPGLGSR